MEINMSTLEIVLTVEVALLVAIVVVLLITLIRRDRQIERGYQNDHSPRYGYTGSSAFADNGGGYPQRRNQYSAPGVPGMSYKNTYPGAGSNYTACPADEKTIITPHVMRQEQSYTVQPRKQAGILNEQNATLQRTHTVPAAKRTYTVPAPPRTHTVPEPQNAQGVRKSASGAQPRWRIDLVEMSSGHKVSREFRNILVAGRWMPSAIESGRLYLSVDATVSRSQFCLYAAEDGIMIENLSIVNITRKNGYPVWQPVRLEEGDILELGRMRYLVKNIRPAA
jgi:pSer/pThr/pTyr-binding forkhead associated (FHA) protein